MIKSNSFFYDAVKGIYLNNDIVKCNIISIPTTQNENEEKITLISSLSRFESMVNFLYQELNKMKSINNSQKKNLAKDEINEFEYKEAKNKGKVLISVKNEK